MIGLLGRVVASPGGTVLGAALGFSVAWGLQGWRLDRSQAEVKAQLEQRLAAEGNRALAAEEHAQALAEQAEELARQYQEERDRAAEQEAELDRTYRRLREARNAVDIMANTLEEAVDNAPDDWREGRVPSAVARAVIELRESVVQGAGDDEGLDDEPARDSGSEFSDPDAGLQRPGG